jgi:NAD(P)-dependent dehydrogenase (short-subunit alcohol dehydrogenase family)
VTGAASGIGRATAELLRAGGHRVLGVDRHGSDIDADLGTAEGRERAVAAITDRSDGVLDGAVTCAGLGPLPGRAGSAIVSVNYFGTVELLTALRPLLAAAPAAAAVAISSNSATTVPGGSRELVARCLAGDEPGARTLADTLDPLVGPYPASKVAVARWVRRQAVTEAWIGTGIRLNAVAPGLTETAMVAEGRADTTLRPLLDSYPVPAGRGATPGEVASVIAFLLGPGAASCCGSVVYADGGTDALLRADDWPALWEPA